MVHLLPLPGSPRFGGSMDEVVSTAAADARILTDAGFPALMIENFGDAPFHAEAVPAETVAAMTVVVREIAHVGVAIGINVLRNDALSAVAIAAATGARFIRVNVLTGIMYTDQGPIVGRAAELVRKRAALAPNLEIWADVMVKHSTPPQGLDLRQAAVDTVERGLADAVIVSGSGTGETIGIDEAKQLRESVPRGTRVVAGSGVTPDTLDSTLAAVDTVIVGSSVKIDGRADNRPDPLRVKAFVETAKERGLL